MTKKDVLKNSRYHLIRAVNSNTAQVQICTSWASTDLGLDLDLSLTMGRGQTIKAVALDILNIFTPSEIRTRNSNSKIFPLQTNCKKIPIRKAKTAPYVR